MCYVPLPLNGRTLTTTLILPPPDAMTGAADSELYSLNKSCRQPSPRRTAERQSVFSCKKADGHKESACLLLCIVVVCCKQVAVQCVGVVCG